MFDIDNILGNKKSKKNKDPLRDLFGIKPSARAKPKNNIVKSDFMSLFLGQGNPRPDRKTPKQKAFHKKTRTGSGNSHKRFWDLDGDGVIAGLDCAPRNSKKHMAWRDPEPYDNIEYMKPREFLQKTGTPNFGLRNSEVEGVSDDHDAMYYDTETEQSEPIDKLGDHIKSPSKKVPIPFVGPFGEHEGRHRAFAAERKGITSIPVKRPPPDSWRSKDVVESFMDKRFPTMGDDYKETWAKRFKREDFPETMMDSDSREAYSQVLKEKGLVKDAEDEKEPKVQ